MDTIFVVRTHDEFGTKYDRQYADKGNAENRAKELQPHYEMVEVVIANGRIENCYDMRG